MNNEQIKNKSAFFFKTWLEPWALVNHKGLLKMFILRLIYLPVIFMLT